MMGLFVSAEVIGDGLCRRAWAPGRADAGRGGLRCRAGVRDTAGPSFGRGDRAPRSPGVLARRGAAASGVRDAVRFRATGSPGG